MVADTDFSQQALKEMRYLCCFCSRPHFTEAGARRCEELHRRSQTTMIRACSCRSCKYSSDWRGVFGTCILHHFPVAEWECCTDNPELAPLLPPPTPQTHKEETTSDS